MIRLSPVLFLTSLGLVALSALGQSTAPKPRVVLTKLGPIAYPQIARTAHISGDVDVDLEIRKDGTVEMATVVSGPPLLYKAALQSARESQFECRDCGDKPASYHLAYSFQLVGAETCCAAETNPSNTRFSNEPFPRISRTGNHVTVVDQVVCICDPTATLGKRRSLKCLYLWRCGSS